jgi:hypothetical protein
LASDIAQGIQTESVLKTVLIIIFGPKRDEMTGGWQKLHNIYSLPIIIRMTKSRRIRGAWHVA